MVKQHDVNKSTYGSIEDPVTLNILPSEMRPTGIGIGWYRFRKDTFQVLRPSVVPNATDRNTPP